MSRRSQGMSTTLEPADSGPLSEIADQVTEGDSAFSLVGPADMALETRLALIDSATTSLDIKYFIWKGDASGSMVFHRLIEAANRGVRVRMLLDDLNLTATDEELAALDAHDNVAINLWNPSEGRSVLGTLVSYASAFDDLNKRMHNKMILADGRIGLFGGRNVADEYFGLTNKYNFLDLDVLVAGPVVADVGRSFDLYWSSPLSVSVSELHPTDAVLPLAVYMDEVGEELEQHRDKLEPLGLDRRDWSDWFATHADTWHQGSAIYLQDDPVRANEETKRLTDYLEEHAAVATSELDMVSAYLIPDDQLLAETKRHVDAGVRVRVVTGTQESINHTAAYAHYRGDIGKILDTGAELYEIDGQPPAPVRRLADTPPYRGAYMAIHLKGLVADRRLAFIGSLNLDPRALDINTEGGLLIDSEGLAGELAEAVDLLTSKDYAWRVTRGDDGALVWTGKGETRDGSPHRGNMQRLSANLFQQLPIRSQL